MDASTKTRARPVDGKAIASLMLAVVAVLTVKLWLVATIVAVAAVSLALASRRSLRADPQLRGTALGLAGFLLAGGVLLFATVGPSLLMSWLMFVGSLS